MGKECFADDDTSRVPNGRSAGIGELPSALGACQEALGAYPRPSGTRARPDEAAAPAGDSGLGYTEVRTGAHCQANCEDLYRAEGKTKGQKVGMSAQGPTDESQATFRQWVGCSSVTTGRTTSPRDARRRIEGATP